MKNVVLAIGLSFLFLFSAAQVDPSEKQKALSLVQANLKSIGMTETDFQNSEVSSTYESTGSGIRMVYLQQTYLGIPVHNKLRVLAFRQGALVSSTGDHLSHLSDRVNASQGIPAITATQAVETVLRTLNLAPLSAVRELGRTGSVIQFGSMGISEVEIKATLVWLPMSDSKKVRLTWQVEIAPIKTSDHLLIRIDALENRELDRDNYTVYEKHEDHAGSSAYHHIQDQAPVQELFSDKASEPSPAVVSSATYRVIPFPAESPLHTGGTAALVTDPWTLAPGNATSLKWHNDGSVEHDSTRGNNVWAQEDRDNNNTTFGRTGVSSTPQPNLTLDYVPDYTVAPTTTTFQRFATTNLFYWNNLLHDITYVYGFDEVSGNFQNNNQGRGGLGADYVIADAQDASGTNNANFSTPVDGQRPRMQMYLSTYNTPNRDGDLDNGVIAHEFGHGLSNRLTGGPGNSSCLQNAEQGGEGWSDYLALMTTTNWATANIGDGTIPRPIGTYLFGQSPSGAGIRTYPYCTNMSVNPNTYAVMASVSGVHRIGEIWCSALWDMTWEMIALDGINPNIFNPSAQGGNSAALKLVVEGMRLQPCSPGYIDARNAILRADTLFFGAKYSCAIWKAFARRGMGKFASQGSSTSTTDQVADFTDPGGITFKLTQSVTAQQEGLNVTYNHTVTVGNCTSISNYQIRDTLPSNVTHVSGGTYDPVARVVSFTVNQAIGTTQTYAYTVSVNAGSYFPTTFYINDSVPSTTVSSVWTRTSTTTTNWVTSTAQRTSLPNSLYSQNLAVTSDQKLETTSAISLPSGRGLRLVFQGSINSEPGWDGGVVEVSTNGGTSWSDLGSRMVAGGYNGSLNSSGTNPIRGRSAFQGNSGGFVRTIIDLASFAGQSAKFRFRFGSDESVSATGWYLDDINIIDQALINIRSEFFNATGTRIGVADTVTQILPGTACDTGVVVTQPQSAAVCEGSAGVTFTVVATGAGLTYQWQSAPEGSSTFTAISGATSASYTTSSVAASLNGTQYRCIINGTCTANLITSVATLSVNPLPAAPTAVNGSRCGSGTVILSVSVGAGITVDWYANGTGGTPLQTGSSSFTTPVLSATTSYFAQARNSATGCLSAGRVAVVATINAPSSSSQSVAVCPSQLPLNWSGGTITASGTYRDTLVNVAGCDSLITLVVTVKSNSSQTINASVCPSQLPYLWNGGSYTISGTYRDTLVNSAGCDSVIILNLTVKANSTSNTSVSICHSELPYVWNGNTYTIGGIYFDTLVNAAGCDSIARLLLDVGQPLQLFAVTGGGLYFTGSAGVPVGLSGSESGISYQLLRDGSSVGTAVSGTGSAISFGNQTATGTYKVLASTASGCTRLMSDSAIVTVSSALPQTYTVTGGGYYCSGTAGVAIGLSGSEAGVNYQLQRISGVNVGAPVSGTGSAISFGLQTLADRYRVVATRAGTSLSSVMTNTVEVRLVSSTSAAPTPGSISGISNACFFIGGSQPAVYLISPVANATSYNWTVPAGASIVGSATDTSISVTYSSAFVSGSITVSARNACYNSTSAARSLTLSRTVPARPSSVTGPTDVCSFIGSATVSSPVTYRVTKVPFATGYSWSVPAGVTIVSQTDTILVVTFASSFVSGALSVSSVNGCGSSTSALSLTVYKRTAAQPGTIQKTFTPSVPAVTSVCGLVSETYRIRKVTYATSYNWVMRSGAFGTVTRLNGPGVNDTAVSVSFAAGFTRDTLQVQAITACSVSSFRTVALTALLSPPAPNVITASTGNLLPCRGQVVTYTLSAPAPTSSQSARAIYRIIARPANTTIVSAAPDTSSFTLSFLSGYSGGSLTVRSQSACGVQSSSFTTVLKFQTPTPSSITSGSGVYSACPGTTNTYTVVVPAPSSTQVAATVYRWTKPSFTTITSANTDSSSISLRFDAGYTGGVLSVKGQTACGFQGSAKTQPLTLAVCTPFTKRPDDATSSSLVLSVFPNPTRDIFRLNIDREVMAESVEIMDMQGRRVWQAQQISLRNLELGRTLKQGTYLLRVHAGGRIQTLRLIKG